MGEGRVIDNALVLVRTASYRSPLKPRRWRGLYLEKDSK